MSESGIASNRYGGPEAGVGKVAKVTLAAGGGRNGYGLDERSNSARSSTMRRHNPIPEGSGQPPVGEAPVWGPGIASDRYGGAAAGQGVVMGKGSRCYNPEGQRARGPEGQRARGPEGQRARGPEGRAGVVMSWVLPLVGCGGPSVSRCGHETRRHRVRGALFASVFASVLLAACGGGSGGNLTTSSETEPGPPGTGPLTATGDGDGQGSESENEQQQQIIIVNQEEEQQQEIVVNIQPDPEESESEEQEEESEEEEEQQRQLTIIEEEDFPYVPPEEEEPRYSAQTQTQTQGSGQGSGNSLARTGIPEPKAIENCGNINTNTVVNCAPIAGQSSSISGTGYAVDYTVNNNWYSSSFVNLQGKDRDLEANLIGRTNNAAFNPSDANYNFAYNMDARKDIEVTYTKGNGFHGFYSYEGASGQITEDVTLKANFSSGKIYIDGHIGDNNGITMEGTNFGQIKFSTSKISEDGQFIIDNGSLHFSNLTIRPESGTFNILRGSFKNDGTRFSFPTQLVGELEMKRFFDTSAVRSNKPLEYNKNVFSRGDNALAGVFVADKTNEVAIRSFPLRVSSEGNIGMFSYGLWADELPQECGFSSCSPSPHYRAELSIPKGQEIFYPVTPVETVNLGAGIGTISARDSIDVTYKKEDGFRGAYIYKDQTGTITSDVHLQATFVSNVNNGRETMQVKGFLAKPFTMEGDSFSGIVLQGLNVIANDGSVVKSIGDNTIRFGTALFNATTGNIDNINPQPNIQQQGNFSITVGATAGQEGSVSLKNYPEHIGGEIKVTGFSLDETENYADNTIVGVFVGDRDSARNNNKNKDIE